MVDYLGYRAKMGVTTPSTNTVVQPEYDDMRPPGVTNHLGRMHIENMDTVDAVGPRNALFMARKEKFDRIFVRVSHDRLNAAAHVI